MRISIKGSDETGVKAITCQQCGSALYRKYDPKTRDYIYETVLTYDYNDGY